VNRVAELTWPTAVGSGVLLGCLVVAYIGFFISCFVALVIFGTIIKDHYEDLNGTEKRENDGKNIQSDGEPNQSPSLDIKLLRQNLLRVGNGDKIAHQSPHQLAGRGQMISTMTRLRISYVKQLFYGMVFPLLHLDFCWRELTHKSNSVAKQPNEKS
jgi:hypothetical protein